MITDWIALAVSIAALLIAFLGWNSNRKRVRKLEQLAAVNLEIVPLAKPTWLDGGRPRYGVTNKGTETVMWVKMDGDHLSGVGIGGATTFISIEHGEVAEGFWFKEASEDDLPATVKFIWTHPFPGSQHAVVPPHPGRETNPPTSPPQGSGSAS